MTYKCVGRVLWIHANSPVAGVLVSCFKPHSSHIISYHIISGPVVFTAIFYCLFRDIPIRALKVPTIFGTAERNHKQRQQQTKKRRRKQQHIFSHDATAPSGQGPPYYRGFTITLRHTTVGRIPVEDTSTRRRNARLFERIVGVLTTCHTQYTWDSSICISFI